MLGLPSSPTEIESAVGNLRDDQIERIIFLSRDETLSPEKIAQAVKGDKQQVRTLVAAFRKIDAMAYRDAKKNSRHVSDEVMLAYHAPGPGRYNDKRRANGHYDLDQDSRRAPGHIGGVPVASPA